MNCYDEQIKSKKTHVSILSVILAFVSIIAGSLVVPQSATGENTWTDSSSSRKESSIIPTFYSSDHGGNQRTSGRSSEQSMRFQIQKTYDEIREHDDVLLLEDLPSVLVGTIGTVIEKEEETIDGVTYRWIIVRWKLRDRPTHAMPLIDSFAEKDLYKLNFKNPD